VYVNDQIVYFIYQEPVIQNGSLLVPLREIFEELGASVEWDETTKGIKAVKGKTVVQLTVGKKAAVKNGSNIEMAIAPKVINAQPWSHYASFQKL
jgi:hypothetical protein